MCERDRAMKQLTGLTEPSWKGNLAKKRGREVLERGGDRYKAEEEEWVVEVVEVVVYSCSVSREKRVKGGRSSEWADCWSCRVQRAPGTMLTSITTVWHMCVCVWMTELMCMRGCVSHSIWRCCTCEHTHTYTRLCADTPFTKDTYAHWHAGTQADWTHWWATFLGIKQCWWLRYRESDTKVTNTIKWMVRKWPNTHCQEWISLMPEQSSC